MARMTLSYALFGAQVESWEALVAIGVLAIVGMMIYLVVGRCTRAWYFEVRFHPLA